MVTDSEANSLVHLAPQRVRYLCCSDKEAFKPHKMAVMSLNPDPIKKQEEFVKKQNLNVGAHSGGNIFKSVICIISRNTAMRRLK